MFDRVGSFATRFRWHIIAVWFIAAVVLTLVAPNINDVAVSDQRAFLPSTAVSLDASATVKKYFPDRVSPSNAVIVVDAGKGGRVDQGQTAGFISRLTTWINSAKSLPAIKDVVSPTLGDEQTKAALTSADRQVALVLVRFNAAGTEPETAEALSQITEQLKATPPGVRTYMTGDAPILAAYNESSKKSMASTTWITIILVIVILLLIYRSPVSPLIPLVTIALAYLISRAVVAFLGAHVMTISTYTNVFLIVVLFGAGTDYCLFLISRFREEMAGAVTTTQAARSTVRSVGEVISSSAGTVIVGLAMMTFARLGLYNTSGPSIAIGVVIALLAGLTLTPAILSILGARAFWPRRPQRKKESGLWHSWSGKVLKRPWVALVVPVIILIPLAVYGMGVSRDFDLLGDLPKSAEARAGFTTLSDHLGAGAMSPLTIVVTDSSGYSNGNGLKRTKQLVAAISKLDNVATVRSLPGSISNPKTLQVYDQLGVQANGVLAVVAQFVHYSSGLDARIPLAADQAEKLKSAAASLTDVYGYLTELAQSYPDVTKSAGYGASIAALVQLSKLANSSGVTAGAGATDVAARTPTSQVFGQIVIRLQNLVGGLDQLQQSFAGRTDALLLPQIYLKSSPGLSALRKAYISADGTAARLQIVLKTGPYGDEAISTAQTLRGILKTNGYTGAVEGTSAIMLDMRDASNRDMTQTIIFVLAGIFVVLVLLLRAFVAPIYLILTILVSYAATLGVVRLLFVDLLGATGIVWWVPMFMFVMLVALGMDYNIFLIGRVKEEVALGGTRKGTRLALARTGGIITSAGIIMAGTFASMMSASLLGLMQIGFAVAFGVLLDTFVVRTTLVPAIVVLLGRWSWWPRKAPRPKASHQD